MRKELDLYEVLLIVSPKLLEKEVADRVQFYQDFLVKKGSKVMVQNQGRPCKLSYAIKKFETANFVQLVFLGNGQLLNEFSSVVRRDESILRHMTTKLNDSLVV